MPCRARQAGSPASLRPCRDGACRLSSGDPGGVLGGRQQRGFDGLPTPPQVTSQERGQQPPRRTASTRSADEPNDADHGHQDQSEGMALEVVMHVDLPTPTGRARLGPIGAVRDAPFVLFQSPDGFVDQGATFAGRLSARDQARIGLRKRESTRAHGVASLFWETQRTTPPLPLCPESGWPPVPSRLACGSCQAVCAQTPVSERDADAEVML